MAPIKKGGKAVDIWKRKKWYNLVAPKLFEEAFLGETPATEVKQLIGRTAKINLMTLTNDMKKQNINVVFEVKNVINDKAETDLIRYEVVPSFIKKLVRREKDRIDDSFLCQTSDSKIVRIKPFMLSTAKISKSRQSLIRKVSRDHLFKKIAKMTYDDVLVEVITNKLQKELREAVTKVYPLKSCEIRVLELMKGITKIPKIESVELTSKEEEDEIVEEAKPVEKAEAE